MKRRKFLYSSSVAGLASALHANKYLKNSIGMENKKIEAKTNPLALTMWDFSWIERRWSGAGYEDWDVALEELVERGYNAVRIDAYPHLISSDKNKVWTIKPVWSVCDWGSPVIIQIQIQPSLNQFIAKCKEYNVKVGLSTWYREDADNVRMGITTPEIMADQWIKTLQSIQKEGLLDNVFYVDLCNEWPGSLWAPFFKNNPPELTWGGWYTTNSMDWMASAVNRVKKAFPELPVGVSFEIKDIDKLRNRDVSFVDYLEPHIWMCQRNNNEFYRKIDFQDDQFSYIGFETMAEKGFNLYNSDRKYWQNLLINYIQDMGRMSDTLNLPSMTSECWAIVNYKDLPGLEWDWIKELCEIGTSTAAETGQWVAVATSNFCGPQFVGMWKDVAWHRNLTNRIKSAEINSLLHDTLLVKRIML